MKKNLLYILFILFAWVSASRMYFLLKYINKNDIEKGVVCKVNSASRSGHSYLYYDIRSIDNKYYRHSDYPLGIALSIGDSVTFRVLHNNISVRILDANNQKVNRYYYIVDCFWVVCFAISCSIIGSFIKSELS